MKAARTPRRAVAAADRTRQPTEVRRRLIVEAAVPLIAERGYASVGVRDVAAAAGVSVGTVTYHFGSVQEILSEAMVLHIERYYAALSEAAAQAAGAAEALRLLVDALFTEDTDRHWRMWFDYWNAGDQDPDQAFARGQAERYEAWHTQIRELAERGVAEGEFSSDDLDGFTVRFAALADGLALQRLRQAPPLSTEDARRHLNRLIETELRHGSCSS
ncbi:TetR/AcrR family transcriptional regulator [Streptomyces sp. WAC00263]|uniref:TetR/AcrR family transcriptional regulator n=1 Tax=Streptomyces sp. WAC00263 TaxID=1917422 RepID=UPI001F5089DF|nr:TetR family transcriptional regulator C-terminal domain-containing protein [Streptomyces sp. WAC00263]